MAILMVPNIFKGTITINNEGAWNFSTGNPPVELRGGLTNNGTFTSGSGTYSFTATASQNISGTQTNHF